jgi:hypothetical protein
MNERIKALLNKLDFNGCVDLFNRLEKGHPMIDMVFDRMEEIDCDRFEVWLDEM